MDVAIIARFWAKVDKDGPIPEHRPELGPCWLWTRAPTSEGYGSFWVRGKQTRQAHTISWELERGPVPEGLELDHLCRVRRCVRVSHLEAVPHRENVLRGVGPAAINAAKERCNQGHRFTPENTYVDPKGNRNCQTCQRAAEAAYRARRSERQL
jgi:hypothetical protein